MRIFKIGNWSCKKRVFSLLLLFGLSYLVIQAFEPSSVASNTKNNVESSLPIPSYNLTFESLTAFYNRNQSLPQAIFQRNWTVLPGNVSFSKYEMNTSDLQSSELYVYDVQWVPTESCIIVVVSERGLPTVRPPDLGIYIYSFH
jgi:hypothetical protein